MPNNYTATNSIPMTASPSTNGIVQKFFAASTNTGPSTYAPDGLSSAPIFGLGGNALQGGEIVNGGIVTLVSFISALLNGGNLCWVLFDCTSAAQQIGAATASLHAVQAAQVAAGVPNTATAGGTANAITASFVMSATAFSDGQPFTIISSTTNTSAVTATLTLGGTTQTTIPIVKGNNQALVAGDYPAGYPGTFNYSAGFGALVMQNPASSTSSGGGGGGGHGQCRLIKSGSNIALIPVNGNKLIINGVTQTVPSSGVTLAPTGLTSQTATTTRSISSNVATLGHAALSAAIPVGTIVLIAGVGGSPVYNGLKTVTASTSTSTSYAAIAANESTIADTGGSILPAYYIYASMSSGVMTLSASTTGHATDATTGVEIKSGDATQTLVGMVALVAGAFVDSNTQRFVSSWFNRVPVFLRNNFTTTRSTTSSVLVEVNAEIRVQTLSWAGDVLRCSISGAAAASAGSGGVSAEAAILMDGTVSTSALLGSALQIQVPGNGGNNQQFIVPIAVQMTEGPHFFTVGGDVGGGFSLNFTGNAGATAYQLYVSS